MDKIILGLLMITRLTIYELRGIIETNFTAMCSSSMGSIQAAVKKLLEQNMAIYEECVENNVYKKVYSLTDTGKEYFLEWVQTAILTGKTKDMELSKLFFMGFVPARRRVPLIEAHLTGLEEELEQLESLRQQDTADTLGYAARGEGNTGQNRLVPAGVQSDAEYTTKDIADFELLTLQLGIDRTNFEIEWFGKLRDRLIRESTAEKRQEGTV